MINKDLFIYNPITFLGIPYLLGLTVYELCKYSIFAGQTSSFYLILYLFLSTALPFAILYFSYKWFKSFNRIIRLSNLKAKSNFQLKGSLFTSLLLFILISFYLINYTLIDLSIFFLPTSQYFLSPVVYSSSILKVNLSTHLILFCIFIPISLIKRTSSFHYYGLFTLFFLLFFKFFLTFQDSLNSLIELKYQTIISETVIIPIILSLIFFGLVFFRAFIDYLLYNNCISDWSFPSLSSIESNHFIKLLFLSLSVCSFFVGFYINYI